MIWFSRARFILSFVSARGLQYLAPILTANLLSQSDYGAIEFALATASMAIGLASLGTVGVVPYVMLSSLGSATLGAVVLHQVGIAALSLIVCGLVAALLSPTSSLAFAALFTAVLALQGFWVYILRANGAVALSLYLEASPFTIVAVTAAAASVWIPADSLLLIACTLFCVLLGWIWATFSEWPRLVLSTRPLCYTATLAVSIPLMLGGLFTLFATISGRLGVGLLGSMELSGAFAALSRIAALPIVAHQLAVVAYFRDLYAIDLPQLERLVTKVIKYVACAVFLTLMTLLWASPWLGSAFHFAAQQYPFVALLLVAQVTLWSGISLNDTIAARYGVMTSVLPWTGSTLLIVVTVALWCMISEVVTLREFAIWHTIVMFTLFASQTVALTCLGVRLMRFWGTCVLAFVFATVFAVCLTYSL